ncbi:MAG: bacillithiol biosynthesis deacetylase BshB1 [Gemmatimonadota bacterium]|jgi:bacillithiol biosynthesis deacetylase BshB1
MTESLDLLAVMAHPDDAELLCGGTLIKSAKLGKRVGVLDLTSGEMGSSGSADIRTREAGQAAEVMGLAERRCAGLPDAQLENDHASRLVVAGILRELRPRVVVTHWRVGRHRDHRIACELVRDACYLSGLRRLEVEGRPFRPRKVVYATAYREDADPPDLVVDVTDEMDVKLEALSSYTSQFEGISGIGEVFPAGNRPIFDQIRAKMAHYGSLIRVEYGEPFRVDEPFAVDDLSDMSVSTY